MSAVTTDGKRALYCSQSRLWYTRISAMEIADRCQSTGALACRGYHCNHWSHWKATGNTSGAMNKDMLATTIRGWTQ